VQEKQEVEALSKDGFLFFSISSWLLSFVQRMFFRTRLPPGFQICKCFQRSCRDDDDDCEPLDVSNHDFVQNGPPKIYATGRACLYHPHWALIIRMFSSKIRLRKNVWSFRKIPSLNTLVELSPQFFSISVFLEIPFP